MLPHYPYCILFPTFFFPWKTLLPCTVHALRTYIDRTKGFGRNYQLFVSWGMLENLLQSKGSPTGFWGRFLQLIQARYCRDHRACKLIPLLASPHSGPCLEGFLLRAFVWQWANLHPSPLSGFIDWISLLWAQDLYYWLSAGSCWNNLVWQYESLHIP